MEPDRHCYNKMEVKEVFDCKLCGVCCQGEGGIYLESEKADAPARILGLTTKEFKEIYTEPKYGLLSLKTDGDGYCLLHDRQTHTCRIHEAKPRMCRDWPFFYGMLSVRQAFEDAKDACPGIRPEASWEDFLEYHRIHVGGWPARSYIFNGQKADDALKRDHRDKSVLDKDNKKGD